MNKPASTEIEKESTSVELFVRHLALELWVAEYKDLNPGATTEEVLKIWRQDVGLVRHKRKMVLNALQRMKAKGIEL